MSATDDIDFTKVGAPVVLKALPDFASDYLPSRGWTQKAVREAGLRWIDGPAVASIWPGTSQGHPPRHFGSTAAMLRGTSYQPRGGIVLPFPDDPTFCVVRIFYEVFNLDGGKDPNDDSKFRTPIGKPLQVYRPPSVTLADLTDSTKPLIVIESPFKAALAASRGLTCVGVNGCGGTHEPATHLLPGATAAQARATIRAELHEFLLPGRPVSLITDADVRTNLNVRRAQLSFMDAAAIGFGCVPEYVEMPDLGSGKTGVDDYFAAGHKLADFQKLPRHARDSKAVRELRNAFRELTEIGLSERFAASHGDDCRHDPVADEWYTYTSKGYRPGPTEPQRRMADVVASLAAELAAEKNEGAAKARARFQNSAGKRGAIDAALTLAGRLRDLEIDSAKFDIDSDLLGMQNGVLRLSTGNLLVPSRELLVTKACPVAYDPSLRSRAWGKFIERASDGDPTLLRYQQEVAGSLLLGRADRNEALFAHGPAFSGKTIFLEAFIDALGPDYALASKAAIILKARQSTDAERSSPFLVSLRGKRFVGCSELDEGAVVDEATLKDLTGGDTITARGNYKDPVQFRNTARVMVRCNHLPNIVGTDDSIWSRVLVVPFPVVIPEHERDKELRQKLRAELPGIVNWALAGLRRYALRGYRFELPKCVTDAMRAYRGNSDALGHWIDECVEIDPKKSDVPFRELQSEVTASYTDWAKRNNHMPMSSRSLWQRLRDRTGFDPVFRGDGGVKYVRGFRLRRNPIAVNLIHHQHVQLDARDAEIAQLRRELTALKGEDDGPGTTTSTTSSAKTLFRH